MFNCSANNKSRLIIMFLRVTAIRHYALFSIIPVPVRAAGPGDRGSIPAEAKDFSSSLCVHTALGSTQSPVQWVPGFFSRG
jgi:hypothetical protein